MHYNQTNYPDRANPACRLNLMPNFTDVGVSLSQRSGPSMVVISVLYTGAATFYFK
jgi:hypothetical protein